MCESKDSMGDGDGAGAANTGATVYETALSRETAALETAWRLRRTVLPALDKSSMQGLVAAMPCAFASAAVRALGPLPYVRSMMELVAASIRGSHLDAPMFVISCIRTISPIKAFQIACECGHGSIVKMLAKPPFSLGQEDARADNNFALCMACNKGHADVAKTGAFEKTPEFGWRPRHAVLTREARSLGTAGLRHL